MKIIIEDTDYLMSEFQVPADIYISKNLPVSNAKARAYSSDDGHYYILMHDCNHDENHMMYVSTDPQDAANFWTQTLRILGYTNDQQIQSAVESMERLNKDFPPDS